MVYIKRLNKKKLVKDLFGIITIPISFTILIDILVMNNIIDNNLLLVFGIDKKSGAYYFLNEFVNFGELQYLYHILIASACITILGLNMYFYWKNNRQERLLIIEHSSLNQIKFSIDKDIKSQYNCKEYQFNEYDTFCNKSNLNEMILQVINEVNLNVSEIKKFIRKDYSIGYAGIANIPATFMLGYELGDENTRKYFHKYHGKRTDFDLKNDCFYMLKEKQLRSTFHLDIVNKPSAYNENSSIVILVSLTQPIKEADYKSLISKDDIILKYTSSDEIDYDIIDSENQIEEYTNKILSDIADLQKEENINEIKICIAASSAFIFGLGTKFSKTQNKQTIIYHFDKDHYSWGINVTKQIPILNVLE